MSDIHKQAFIEEALELLAELEVSLIELEKSPDDKEIIAKVFRALHTIKGSSGMFGYDDITMFTHDIETVYHLIRNGDIKITKQIIDLTLLAKDQIKLMLDNEGGTRYNDEQITGEIIASFRKMVTDFHSKEDKSAKTEKKHNDSVAAQNSEFKSFYLLFEPNEDIFLSGTNPIMILNELASLGKYIIAGDYSKIPSLYDFNPEKCYSSWEMIIRTDKGMDAIKDAFIFIEDQCFIKVNEIDQSDLLRNDDNFARFEQFVKTNGMKLAGALEKFDRDLKQAAFKETAQIKKAREGQDVHKEADTTSSLRVSSDKLDNLVNLVGELVTLQARLNQVASNTQDQAVQSISEEVERITWSLRDSALNIRMLTIGSTFSKFNRLVRDLSKELGKEVELTTEGAETELDKTVIEKLNDPLVHIIRNSIDHGIETPEKRERMGKPKVGRVHLSAAHSGGNVLIKISDDGAGLNREAILEKAWASGIVAQGAELSDSEIFSLIFAPGFSTAKTVTNVSGRGVGMDVVKRGVESIRGTIEVTSKEWVGTTITLKLPLTLAIIDGLLVSIGDDNYILPLSAVEECIELTKTDVENSHGRNLVNVRGGIIPYINLRESLKIEGIRPPIEQIVISNLNGTKVGFVVDKVFGQHQTVLKTLGKFYNNVEGVSGATILGDGSIALILDIAKLCEREEIVQ